MRQALTAPLFRRWGQQAALPWMVVSAWLGFTVCAFWFFQLRDAASESSLRLFDASGLSREAESWLRTLEVPRSTGARPVATVVHVARSACGCSRFAEPHLRKIIGKYQARGVTFVRPAADALPAWIESTPAALVFDREGRLIYFGPYSDSAWCSSSGGMVEGTLDAVLNGRAPRPQRQYVRGCFCGSDRL